MYRSVYRSLPSQLSLISRTRQAVFSCVLERCDSMLYSIARKTWGSRRTRVPPRTPPGSSTSSQGTTSMTNSSRHGNAVDRAPSSLDQSSEPKSSIEVTRKISRMRASEGRDAAHRALMDHVISTDPKESHCREFSSFRQSGVS